MGTEEVPSEQKNPFSTVGVIKYWHRLPREDVEPSSVEIFKTHGTHASSSPCPSLGMDSCAGCDSQYLLDISLPLLCLWG